MKKNYVFLLLVLMSCNQSQKESSTKAKRQSITESVYASVTIKPTELYYVQTSQSGILDEIFIEEGDDVKKGQTLFNVTVSPQLNNKLTNAEITLKEAETNYLGKDNMLLNIDLEIESMVNQLALDSINYKRYDRLWKQNIGKRTDLDQAKLKYESSTNQLKMLKAKRTQTSVNLENNYKKALSLVKSEKNQMVDLTIRSEIDGRVYSINKEVGELITPQERFAEIGSLDKFIVDMDVDEVDISNIQIGDTAIIQLEAYPDELYTALINKISPKKNESTQTFSVEGEFVIMPMRLYNGFSGEANIVIDRRENALVIPSEYLLSGNKVLTNNGEREVKLGVKNMQFVEIVSGIDTSTIILKPDY